METVGGLLATALTVIVTDSEVVLAPRLSVAIAVMVCCPAETVKGMENGAASLVPTEPPSTKNSTRAMVPSESAASAERVIVSPGLKRAPFVGEVRTTVGG